MSPVQAQGFRQVSDARTGVTLSIPFDVTSNTKGATWGTNWSTDDETLSIDTLNFRGDRNLRSVYDSIRNKRGRRITTDDFDGSSFTLQGTDSDGTVVYVRCEQRGGEVRGLSIVYSARVQRDMAPVASAVVRSFVAFPGSASPPPSPPPSPGVLQPDIAQLQRELEELRRTMSQREEERRKDDEKRKQQDRETEIRREERERAQREAARLEAEIERLKRQAAEMQTPPRPQADRSPPPLTSGLPPGKRVAFVVGINDYPDLASQQQLRKAVNDAALMKATFEKLGFEVVTVSGTGTRREIARAWQIFLRKIEPGASAAFFFAGHGVQLQGVNYLLPSDIPAIQPDNSGMIRDEAINFNSYYSDILARKPRFSLLILDACRDNPFPPDGTRTVGGSRGLTTVKPVEGSFLLYSANADEQALDRLPSDPDTEKNSVFTRMLAPALLQPDVPVQELARRVRVSVSELAGTVGHRQWPSYYDGLTGNLCLVGNCMALAKK